jgi:lysophospholipase L1-like esterase
MKLRIILMISLAGYGVLMAFSERHPLKLFVLGDSISLQYGPFLKEDLAGQFIIERKKGDSVAFRNLDIPNGANGGDSRMVLNYLRLKADDPGFQPDVLMLNCGLHDIKRQPANNKIAVDSLEYRNNLISIYKIVKKKHIPLIWVRTTNVVDSIHIKNKEFRRYHNDLVAYNAIADEVFSHYNVPVADLYSFTINLGGNRFKDHVHYTPETCALQAAYLSGFLQLWKANNKISR